MPVLAVALRNKDLGWVGRSQDDLRDLPASARRDAGHQLHLVQLGLEPDDWRPMTAVGPGVVEIWQGATKMASRTGTLNKSVSGQARKAVVQKSSGNVFADLGFDHDEAEHLRIRSALMAALRQILQDRRLTQAAAAELFDVSQARVSDLVRGKIDQFSIDTLVDMLARANVRVDIRTTVLAR